jgi:hypothetical protein
MQTLAAIIHDENNLLQELRSGWYLGRHLPGNATFG